MPVLDKASVDTLVRVRDRHTKKLLDFRSVSSESVNTDIRREEEAIATITIAIEFLRRKLIAPRGRV